MFFLPSGLKPDRKLLQSPIIWVSAIILLIHCMVFVPQIRTEKTIPKLQEQFRTWWDNTGRFQYASQGIDVDERAYQAFYTQHFLEYTAKKPHYQLILMPETFEPWQILTAGMIQPGWWSVVVFLVFFTYAGLWLADRWTTSRALLAGAVGGLSALLGYLIVTAFVLETDPIKVISGASGATAFLMGILVPLHRQASLNFWYPNPRGQNSNARNPSPNQSDKGQSGVFQWRSIPLPFPIFFILWIVSDALVQLLANPTQYNRLWLINLTLAGIGGFLAFRFDQQLIPNRKILQNSTASHKALTPEEQKRQTRRQLQEAWERMEKYDMDGGWKLLHSALVTLLLQDSEENRELIAKNLHRYFNEKVRPQVSAMELFDLAQKVKGYHLEKEAMELYRQALNEHPPKTIERHAWFQLGTLQHSNGLPEDDIRRSLKAVLADPNIQDGISVKAQRLLDTLSPEKDPEEVRKKAEAAEAAKAAKTKKNKVFFADIGEDMPPPNPQAEEQKPRDIKPDGASPFS